MSAFLDRLSQTRAIVISFIATLLIGFGFGVFGDQVGGVLLDEIMSADAARALIAGMSEAQRDAHFWVTVGLDSAYPIAYGAFLVGLLARLGQNLRRLCVAPAMATVVVDYLENTVQALALVGNDAWLIAKDVLTPLKVSGLLICLALAIGLGIWRWLERLKAGSDSSTR
ncbi:MAG: hypothetical protein NXH85_16080 [Pseudomonadaceae bacterium]|nr:hypothetical protein [Pseudomonadaceae bacterium]